MCYFHRATKRCRFFIGLRARKPGWIPALVLTTTLLSLCGLIQAQAPPSQPSDRDNYITVAESAFADGHFREAVQLYSRAAKALGADATVFRGRAMAREMLNENRKAIEDFKLALQADPTDYESMEHLAGLYERAGTHIPEAIELYKRALDLDPRPAWKDNLAAWIAMLESRLWPEDATAVGCWHRGNEKANKGDLAEAESYYSRALDLNPHMFQAFFSRGLIHLRAGNTASALADFEQTVRIAPGFAQAFMLRGLAREQLGKLAEAHQDFDRAAKMDPRDPAALYHCARTLESEDDQDRALQLYRDALRYRPTPELSASIRKNMSALLPLLRTKRVRNSNGSPEPGALW